MPSISKIRFTNIIYDNKQKRFNDDIFHFDGHNAAILLENGGGKTVFIQCAIQAIIPHTDLGERKIKETLLLDNTCVHIAIEWIIKDRPRKYCVTAVSLYKDASGSVASYRFVNEYAAGYKDSIEHIPFALEAADGRKRPASKEEIGEYYSRAKAESISARTFNTIHEYQDTLSKDYGIIGSEWRSQLEINKNEGGVEKFFDGCSTTGHLVDNLLIPSVEAVIAGDGAKGFARTFENQRDTLKEYNQLTRLIRESNLAAEMLNTYVKEYERLYERQKEMEKMKRQAKALHRLAAEEANGLAERCSVLDNKKEALNREQAEFLRKKASMEVLVCQNQLKVAEKDLAQANDIYEKHKEIYDEKAGRKESIELHKAKREIKEWKYKILSIKEEMERLERDTDIGELREIYEKHAVQLRGCYAQIEENIHKELASVVLRIERCVKEKDLLNNELETASKRMSSLAGKKSQLVGENNNNAKTISDLKRKILIDIKSQSVEEVLNGYNHRLLEIENTQSALASEINQMDIRAAEMKAEEPTVQDKREKVNTELITTRMQLQDIDDAVNKLTTRLIVGYKDFYNLKLYNFYSKDKVIRENLTALTDRANRTKEDALLNERLKKRLWDAYNGSAYFTGSPELYDIIEEIRVKDRFRFIQAGGEFVNQAAGELNISKEEISARFPFWHYAIIVNETDAEKLKTELSARELTCPVLVLTIAKARELIDGQVFDIDSVTPDFWVSNLDKESFKRWKEQIKTQGAAAEETRRGAEESLARIQEDLKAVEDFFAAHPRESYEQMNRSKAELELRLNELTERADALKKERNEIENTRKTAVSQKNELELEAVHIGTNREHAQSILKAEEENKARNGEIMRLEEQIAETEESIQGLKLKIKSAEMNITGQNQERNEVHGQLRILQNEDWYKKVKNRPADTGGDIPKNALIEKLKELELELLKVDKDNRVLSEKRNDCQSNLERAESYFKKLKIEAKYPWEEQSEYYEGMELELAGLMAQLPELKRTLDNQETKVKKFNEAWGRKDELYKDCFKKFKSRYEDVYIFRQSISEAKEALYEEEDIITSKSALLEKEMTTAKEEREKADEAVAKLNTLERIFKLANVSAEAEEFVDALSYPYNRLKVVENMDMELQRAANHIQEEVQRVNSAKERYCNHCRREISDVRNREKLIEIADKAGNYEELTEKQKAMNGSLERARTMAQSTLADREEKMVQFTNHLYTHVEKIAKELQLIPKKTRIRIHDGSWKEIFDIGIAEWDEKEAQMALRSQINYILDRIENYQDYKTDEGTEDITKIRAFIEKSLKTKQLLKKIMGSNEIRVRCRKVTNDNQVSNRFYSWEESEKWSGGERWSKNMALFLGIQNYIAEKTEPDLKAGKSKSSVFLDNPFGKASSEHVLNPVFFIAEELGFQIITVTAHAEGKFISDYFPIIYSLKLREASGVKTSVITKELTIKHAYFEDKDPISIDRLMPKEQMSLLFSPSI